jgi:hypothetical protein
MFLRSAGLDGAVKGWRLSREQEDTPRRRREQEDTPGRRVRSHVLVTDAAG